MNEYYGNNSFNQNDSNSGFYGQQFVFCSNCGAKLTPDKKFCSNCGAPLKTNNPNNNFTPPPQAQPMPNNTHYVQQNAYSVPQPKPQYTPYSAPQPEPQYVPQSEPQYVPQSEPQYIPQPEPQYVPQPEPQFIPQPEPQFVPQPEPQYIPQPEPQYVPQPEPQYIPQPEPQYIPQPEPQYIPQPEPQYNNAYSAPQYEQQPYNNAQQFTNQYSHTAFTTLKPQKNRNKSKTKSHILSIISSSLMVIIAIIMFVLPFTSLMTLKADIPVIDESIKINFSVLDMLNLSASSFQSIDDNEIEDKIDDLYEKYEDEMEDWQDGDKLNKVGTFIKQYLNILLKSEEIPKSPMFGTIGVLSILQMVISGVFLIVAICGLIPAIVGKSKFVIPRASFMLFGLSSIFTLTNLYACNKFFNYLTFVIDDMTIGNLFKTSRSNFLIVAFVAMIVGIVAMFIIRLIYKPIKIRAKEIVKRSLAVAFAIVLLVSAFFPILTTDIKAKFDGESKESKVTAPVNSDLFFVFELTESEKESFEEMNNEDTQTPVHSQFEHYRFLTKRALKKDSGAGYIYNASMLQTLTLISGAYEYSSYLALGTVAITFIIFAALFMIWFNICDLITRRKTSTGAIVLIKIFTILMCMIMIALPVVIMVISNFNTEFAEIDYKVNLANGPIVMMVAAIALTSVPATKRRELGE